MLPELGPGQKRAITYLWAATQVAATVVRDAFIEIYTSLPDSGDGHTSIREYCSLVGRNAVYLELLDEGCLISELAESPKDAAFLDLKVTRKMLEKVLADKFCRGSFGKLTYEVRQLVYLRNDLCHQLLPSLPVDQYFARMQQLESRLCIVTRMAGLIVGAASPPDKALQHIRVLFASLRNLKDDHSPYSTERRSLTDSGTQADLHQPTQEKGMQVDTIPHHNNGPKTPRTETMDYPLRQTKEVTSVNVMYDHESAKISDDSADPGTPRCLKCGFVTHCIDASGKGGYHGRQEGQDSCYHDAGCCLKGTSKCLSGDTPAKGNIKLFNCHNTETSPPEVPFSFPGHNLLQDKLCEEAVMTHNTQSNHTSSHVFATLSYTSVPVNQVAHTTHKGLCVSCMMDIGLSVLLTVMFILGVFSVSTLPLVMTFLRLAACGLHYSCVQADRACKHLLRSLPSEYGPRVIGRTEMVIIPRMPQDELLGPVIVSSKGKVIMNYVKSDWKAACRRKKRKNTRMIK